MNIQIGIQYVSVSGLISHVQVKCGLDAVLCSNFRGHSTTISIICAARTRQSSQSMPGNISLSEYLIADVMALDKQCG